MTRPSGCLGDTAFSGSGNGPSGLTLVYPPNVAMSVAYSRGRKGRRQLHRHAALAMGLAAAMFQRAAISPPAFIVPRMPTSHAVEITRPENVPTTPADFDPPLRSCRLCGATDIQRFDVDYRGVQISKCGACGVKFMNPQY
ncbi:MAG TPA: hypothetical protein VJN70_11400, partial [Gemmatimonadaceae bacterium]|nr:hypothetical protein [Gemmatimonadaceae bacterium]